MFFGGFFKWHRFLIYWGPMLLLIGVWLFIIEKGGQLNYKKYVDDMSVIARDQLEEQRKTNAALLRIERLLTEQVRRDD
jgi:hypothetical protein